MTPTNRFNELLANRMANPEMPDIRLKYFSIGDGGDSLPEDIIGLAQVSQLSNEIYRNTLDTVAKSAPTTVVAEGYIPTHEGPFTFNEVGIWDDGAENSGTSELMFISEYPETTKNLGNGNVIEDIKISAVATINNGAENIEVYLNPYMADMASHAHRGENTAKIDHDNLLNKGTIKHTDIDLQINSINSTLANHINNEGPVVYDHNKIDLHIQQMASLLPYSAYYPTYVNVTQTSDEWYNFIMLTCKYSYVSTRPNAYIIKASADSIDFNGGANQIDVRLLISYERYKGTPYEWSVLHFLNAVSVLKIETICSMDLEDRILLQIRKTNPGLMEIHKPFMYMIPTITQDQEGVYGWGYDQEGDYGAEQQHE